MSDEKPIIGILGAIGSGKSTVAREFERLGCGLIDADVIAHEALEDDGIRAQIRDAFGEQVFDSDGRIERNRLAEEVFQDKKRVQQINSIIHPLVFERCEELISEYFADERIKAVVLDMPLLVEAGWDKRCSKLVFVGCYEGNRALRLGKKGEIFANQQKKREFFQISLDKKVEMADYMVDNNSDLSAMAGQVVRIFTIVIEGG